MKTLTIDDIKDLLKNKDVYQLKCLTRILIPYINNKLFNENASLLRKLSGLSLRQVADCFDISAQALSLFEKRKDFPEDKTEKLFQLYLSKAVEFAFNGNKQLLNAFAILFFFKSSLLHPESIKQKEDEFENFKNNINDDIYKEKLKDDSICLIYLSGKEKVYNYLISEISIDPKPVLSALSRNLKIIRFILDKNQYQMADLLNISNKTYSFYENNCNKYTLNAYDACEIIKELFIHFENKKNNKENFYGIIQLLFEQRNDKENSIITETLYDYCIAIKYKQSQRLIDYLKYQLASFSLQIEFKLPIEFKTKQTDKDETDGSIFN